MIALLQRVSSAHVEIGGQQIAQIGRGLLVLVGIERNDHDRVAEQLVDRILGYRVFPDTEGRMNRSVRDVTGGLLLVPQFTLVADTESGLRPSFSRAAEPNLAREQFERTVEFAKKHCPDVQSGRFGADMQVTLTNDGPVTFWLQVPTG